MRDSLIQVAFPYEQALTGKSFVQRQKDRMQPAFSSLNI